MTDIINFLADLPAGHPLLDARNARPDALHNAQLSFEALLEPTDPGSFSQAERYAVATYVAGLHRAERAHAFYADLLADEDASLVNAVAQAIEQGQSTGPYGSFREAELISFSDPGGFVLHTGPSPRLAAAFDIAHLLVFHPRDSRPEAIGHLYSAGWDENGVVSLAQLVSFLAFQLRVIHGLRVLAGQQVASPEGERAPGTEADWQLVDTVQTYPDLVRPQRFLNHALGWQPWVAPVAKADLTQAQHDSLIKPERADMPYFRLLARDPDALQARTLTDLDIFYNTDGGLGRAERELAATVASRSNGCVYCASVHQARAKEEGGDAIAIQALLDEGITTDLQSPQWNQIRDIAVALTATPVAVRDQDFEGLSWAESVDVLYASSFFNWANRLMLFLGEPEVPKRFR